MGLAQLLELVGVLAHGHHQGGAGLAVEAMLEGVVAHLLLALRVRGPVDFWELRRLALTCLGEEFRFLRSDMVVLHL